MSAILATLLAAATAYPHPVLEHAFDSQRQSLQMAYMDIAPAEPNGRTALLLHGKNFCGTYWEDSIQALSAQGYRVLVPEQVGFCRSSLPRHYQYSFQQLAANTRGLVDALDTGPVTLVAHSMGGMLAVRYALMYPDAVEAMVLVNPIGLEDWQRAGVPWVDVDTLFANERRQDFERIREYQQRFYYDGEWSPAYERWARQLADTYEGPDGEAVAWNHALTAEMVFNQPVVHEFGALAVPTGLIIGGRDRTAIGRDRAPDDVADTLGDYPELGRRAASAIPDARLVTFDDIGHMPQVEDTPRYLEALLQLLDELHGGAQEGPGEPTR